MKLMITLSAAALILGYFSGAGVGKMFRDEGVSEDAAVNSVQPSFERSTDRERGEVALSEIVSDDSAATLAEVPGGLLYDRLALWLLDASANEIQEFWEGNFERDDLDPDLLELIFMNWTRIDREAAFAAVEGTRNVRYAWLGWACHEPEKALHDVLGIFQKEGDQSPVYAVLQGLGKYQSNWFRRNIDQLPEKWMRDAAMFEFSRSVGSENIHESIEFLQSQGYQPRIENLADLARESPIEAYEFALAREKKGKNDYHEKRFRRDFLKLLSTDDPAPLARLAEHIQSPDFKLQVRQKYFEALMKTNPAAAEEEMKKMPPGWAKDDLLATMAKATLDSDPQKSIEIAAGFFMEKENPLSRSSMVYIDESGSGFGRESGIFNELVEEIIARDPRSLMEQVVFDLGDEPASRVRPSLMNIGNLWVEQNLDEYAEWVATVEQPALYEHSATTVAWRLKDRSRFQESMEWMQSVSDENQRKGSHLSAIYRDWRTQDAEAAAAWKDAATLDDEIRAQLDLVDQLPTEGK